MLVLLASTVGGLWNTQTGGQPYTAVQAGHHPASLIYAASSASEPGSPLIRKLCCVWVAGFCRFTQAAERQALVEVQRRPHSPHGLAVCSSLSSEDR